MVKIHDLITYSWPLNTKRGFLLVLCLKFMSFKLNFDILFNKAHSTCLVFVL